MSTFITFMVVNPLFFNLFVIDSTQKSFGAGGGGRTHMNVTSQDFESCASANSATPAYLTLFKEIYIYVRYLLDISIFLNSNKYLNIINTYIY